MRYKPSTIHLLPLFFRREPCPIRYFPIPHFILITIPKIVTRNIVNCKFSLQYAKIHSGADLYGPVSSAAGEESEKTFTRFWRSTPLRRFTVIPYSALPGKAGALNT